MDSAIQNLQHWKSKHSQESKEEELELEEEDHPETDAHFHDNILNQLTPRNDMELKEYSHSPEMLNKVSSSSFVVLLL